VIGTAIAGMENTTLSTATTAKDINDFFIIFPHAPLNLNIE